MFYVDRFLVAEVPLCEGLKASQARSIEVSVRQFRLLFLFSLRSPGMTVTRPSLPHTRWHADGHSIQPYCRRADAS